MRMNRFRIAGVVSLGVVMVVLGLWSGSVKAQYTLAAPGGPNIFLRFLESFQQEDFMADPGPPEVIDASLGTADAYYKAVDPFDRRLTMKDWLVTTGFLESATTPWTGAGSAIPDLSTPAGDSNIRVDVANGGSAKATYVNGADLGFGRRMYLRTNADGSLASYVENYGTDKNLFPHASGLPRFFDVPNGDPLQQNILEVAKTRNPDGLVATVVMEYVAPDDDPTGKKRTTFYVYGADGSRVGIAGLNLDGRGSKANPGVCLVCHGGKPQAVVNGVYPNKGDTGAYFLPWDVGTFIFDTEAGFTKEDQEKNFRELNRAVLLQHAQGAKYDAVSGLTRRVAPVELIRGWYGGATLPNETFDESFVPVGWRPSAERGIPVGARKIYREVIGPTCRACHAQRESSLDFATFRGFDVHRDSVVNLTFTVPFALSHAASDDSPARPGDDRGVMPIALRTYENFWNSTAPAQLKNFIDALPPR